MKTTTSKALGGAQEMLSLPGSQIGGHMIVVPPKKIVQTTNMGGVGVIIMDI